MAREKKEKEKEKEKEKSPARRIGVRGGRKDKEEEEKEMEMEKEKEKEKEKGKEKEEEANKASELDKFKCPGRRVRKLRLDDLKDSKVNNCKWYVSADIAKHTYTLATGEEDMVCFMLCSLMYMNIISKYISIL